jgi:hypothetical protein
MPNETAVSSFSITAKTRAFQLDPQGKGVCTFTITNTGKATLDGRVRLTPTGQNPAVADWLTIAEPVEQSYKPNEERSYSVTITVPADAPGGTYLFRAEAYSVANPNDDYIGGPEFSFTVQRDTPAQTTNGFPLWIPFTALALVVAIAALVTVFVMMGRGAPTEATLAQVVGKSEQEANNALVALGFQVNITREPTDKAPEGQVIAQNPPFDEEDPSKNVVKLPGPVTLLVALKPETPMITVPSVRGLTLSEAQQKITAATLVVGVIGEKDEGPGAPGTVVEQFPPEGTSLAAGSGVSVTVKAQPAPSGPVQPSWTGSMRVRQTWMGDLDTGKECDNTTRANADFWFHAKTATDRSIDAQNGTAFGFPTEATLAACSEAIRLAPVTSIDLTSIKPGKLIAARTNRGSYVLMSLAKEVGPSPATMELNYQYFPLRVILPVKPIFRDFKAQPLKPVSTVPAEPLRPATGTVKPVDGTTVKPARLEPREAVRKESIR